MKAGALLAILLVAFLSTSQAVSAGSIYSGRYATPDGLLWPPFAHIPPVRDYRLFVPTSYSRSSRLFPLVVMLHGCKQNADSFAAGTRMNVLAEKEDFLVLYPNQHDYHERIVNRCWSWSDGATQDKGGEAAILTGMVNSIAKQYRVDASRIYVAGLSAGGAMASVLASCYPRVFAAAAVHSGVEYKAAYLFNSVSALGSANTMPPDVAGRRAYECGERAGQVVPVIVFHGTRDTRVHPRHAWQVIEQFAQTNDYADDGEDNDSVSAATPFRRNFHRNGRHSYTVYSYRNGEQVLLQMYLIQGMGHAWSGGSPVLDKDVYYDPLGPDASQEIWKFFKVRRRE